MKQQLLPAIWLIVLIAGLPLFSETVYTPSLPEIAKDLMASDALVEYTLTIYLAGFAIGTLFWGRLSDFYGRKPAIILGFFIYLIGCLMCYLSNNIYLLLISRLIQAFGGSVGSVLGQAISRDSFHGQALGKVYSTVGTALSVFPAIGPLIGGFIAQYFGWHYIFCFLIGFGALVILFTVIYLPETNVFKNNTSKNITATITTKSILIKMLFDKKVLAFGLLVSASNGIMFSFFAEGPFYLIDLLELSPVKYGLTFIVMAAATMSGGFISRKLHNTYDSISILSYGIKTTLIGSSLFMLCILCNQFWAIPKILLLSITIFNMMIIMAGNCIAASNSLSMALVDYKSNVGTASALFGFFYYSCISIITLGMGSLHNDTLLPMPIYFFCIAALMLVIFKIVVCNNKILKNKIIMI